MAGGEQGVERGLRIGGERGRQHHVRRRHPVDHHAPHRLRKLPQVLQRRPRAVGPAHQVDLRRTQRLTHGLGVGHGDGGGELPQIAMRQLLQRRAAVAQALRLRGGVGHLAQRLQRRRLGALQRCAAPSASLVDQHHVAAVGQARQRPRQRAGQRNGALPRPASEEEHRVFLLVAGQRGQHCKVHVDLRARRPGGVQRALDHAAPGFVLQAFQATGGQICPRASPGRGRQRSPGLDAGSGLDRRRHRLCVGRRQPPHPAAHGHENNPCRQGPRPTSMRTRAKNELGRCTITRPRRAKPVFHSLDCPQASPLAPAGEGEWPFQAHGRLARPHEPENHCRRLAGRALVAGQRCFTGASVLSVQTAAKPRQPQPSPTPAGQSTSRA